jgi:hypothetical protein
MLRVLDRSSAVVCLSPYVRDGVTRSPSTARRSYRSSLSLVSDEPSDNMPFTHALLVELTAPNWGAFTAGRVIAYIGVNGAGS